LDDSDAATPDVPQLTSPVMFFSLPSLKCAMTCSEMDRPTRQLPDPLIEMLTMVGFGGGGGGAGGAGAGGAGAGGAGAGPPGGVGAGDPPPAPPPPFDGVETFMVIPPNCCR